MIVESVSEVLALLLHHLQSTDFSLTFQKLLFVECQELSSLFVLYSCINRFLHEGIISDWLSWLIFLMKLLLQYRASHEILGRELVQMALWRLSIGINVTRFHFFELIKGRDSFISFRFHLSTIFSFRSDKLILFSMANRSVWKYVCFTNLAWSHVFREIVVVVKMDLVGWAAVCGLFAHYNYCSASKYLLTDQFK